MMKYACKVIHKRTGRVDGLGYGDTKEVARHYAVRDLKKRAGGRVQLNAKDEEHRFEYNDLVQRERGE